MLLKKLVKKTDEQTDKDEVNWPTAEGSTNGDLLRNDSEKFESYCTWKFLK